MSVLSRIIDGHKFLWDGNTYEDENKALEIEGGYKKKGFETRIISEENSYYVYTRRLVTEVVVDGDGAI